IRSSNPVVIPAALSPSPAAREGGMVQQPAEGMVRVEAHEARQGRSRSKGPAEGRKRAGSPVVRPPGGRRQPDPEAPRTKAPAPASALFRQEGDSREQHV